MKGERLSRSGLCKKCIKGFYLLEAPDRVKDCEKCPENTICFGEDKIAPQ